MPEVPENFGFYAILTDPLVGYTRLTEILVGNNIPFIQLRVKNKDRSFIKKIALSMQSIVKGSNSRLIINDDVLLTKEIEAHGVHLGQEDMPYQEARKILGPDYIIGLSTHNMTQLQTANSLQPDYIGIGPVFATPTKQKPDPVIGLDGLKSMYKAAQVPAIAIGGINMDNLQTVLATGVKNFSAVRLLNESNHPQAVLKVILKI
ncbi:MAG: thiamine phosphate synthase [Candidatus Margulisbacteria bacterium]|nr:thiamine phosphate synthase [Candidatus Margulisiibacteriota bacterium]